MSDMMDLSAPYPLIHNDRRSADEFPEEVMEEIHLLFTQTASLIFLNALDNLPVLGSVSLPLLETYEAELHRQAEPEWFCLPSHLGSVILRGQVDDRKKR